VRDLVTFLRHDTGTGNPLRLSDGKPAIARTYGFGVSQSGRFLRSFLHQDFNRDEQGRRVFDGLMPHVAGGGLGFFIWNSYVGGAYPDIIVGMISIGIAGYLSSALVRLGVGRLTPWLRQGRA